MVLSFVVVGIGFLTGGEMKSGLGKDFAGATKFLFLTGVVGVFLSALVKEKHFLPCFESITSIL